MSSAWRLRATVSSAVGLALAAGVLAAPAAHAAPPVASPAAIVAAQNAVAFTDEALVLVGLKQAAVAEQARLQAEAARAAARAAASARITAQRAKAVSVALSRKGMAYRAGRSGPRAFDCSGFTSYVWRTAGRSIARTSWDQFATLKRIPKKAARPGDLVFFFGRGAHHVAVYLGNNKIIHAANPGDGVTVSSITSGWYADRLSGFRRVV